MHTSDKTALLTVVISFLGIFALSASSLTVDEQIAFAQVNSTSLQVPVSNITGLPESGLQLLLLTKNGGIAGVNEIFSYNIVSKEIASADLRTNLVEKKLLNNSEIENLTSTFYSTGILGDDIFDRNLCPDCIQYGLSYFFIDLEKLVPFSASAFWTDKTVGAEGFMKLAEIIENIAP
jgi:hypothetical protein